MFCKSVGCGDLKLVGVCGWAEHLGGTLASLAACGTKKKKKKKLIIVSRKSSFSLMSLSHTHINTYMRTLSLSLSSISLFILLFCLSFYWMLAGCCNGSLFYLFCVFVFIFTLLGVIINSVALPFQRPKCE